MFYNSKQITSRFLLSLLFLFAPLLATSQTTGTPLVIPGIEFKDPYQSSNSTQINIPVKLTLGSTDKSFTNFGSGQERVTKRGCSGRKYLPDMVFCNLHHSVWATTQTLM